MNADRLDRSVKPLSLKTRLRHLRRTGVTLVELMVVIGIVGALLGVLLPGVQAAREASRVVACKSNLRQLSQAALNCAGQRGSLPALWSGYGVAPWDNFSWRVKLLPYLEEQATFDAFDLQRHPLDAENREVGSESIAIFQCASTNEFGRSVVELGTDHNKFVGLSLAPQDYNAVHDVVVAHREFPLRGIWNGGPEMEFTDQSVPGVPPDVLSAQIRRKPPLLRNVRDGLSHTIMLVEQSGKPQGYGVGFKPTAVPSTEGAWMTADYSSFQAEGVNTDNYTEAYGFHQSANAALGDGSVVALHPELSPNILVAIFSRDGNEIIDRADWNTN